MSPFIEPTLFAFLLVVAFMIVKVRNLFSAAMLTGIFSLLSAGLFTLMDAVDVAFTEAAVGAGISTLLIVATLALTGSVEREDDGHGAQSRLALVVAVATGAALIYGTFDMQPYGDPSAPIHHHLIDRYIVDSMEEIGLPNFVTSILASYRGYDTFGELSVIFTAGTGVTLLLGGLPRRVVSSPPPPPVNAPRKMRMADTVVLRTLTKGLVPFILLFALYVQFHGDFGPGGGFQAGVIFAVGLIAYALIFGADALKEIVPPAVVRFGVSLGLLLYGGTGVACLLRGENFLDYNALDHHHPSHGQHLGILLVELGVGITVTAVMLTIYYCFTGRPRGSDS